jgi:hypothetical protein
LSHEADSLSAARLERVKSLKQRYVDLAAGVIRDVMRADGDDGGDPRIAAYALFGMMNWTYTWYDPAGPVPPGTLAEMFAGWFIQGVAGRRPASAGVPR